MRSIEDEESEPLLTPAQEQAVKKTGVRQLLENRRKLIGSLLTAVAVVFFIIGLVYLVRYQQVYGPGFVLAKHGAVATELQECSQVGVDILKRGGNALDAGIASALCIGTINSFSSGIGGGGFLIYRPANASVQPKVINFRETAPAAARKHMYHGNELLAQRGGLSVSVPGEVHGYEIAHQMFGKLPWSELFEPSILIARNGIECPEELSARLDKYGQTFRDDPDWAPVFAPEGHLLRPGEKLIRTQFADTLEKIARNGSKAFYEGDIAQSLVDHCQRNGGIMTMEDMRNYRALVEDPVISTYRGLEVLTCGAPSSGSVLIEALNILETFNMSKIGNGALGHHYLVEAMKYLSAGRTQMGDPQFLKHAALARVEELQEKEFAASCAANISDSRTFGWEHYHPEYAFSDDHGTTSLSVIDAEGNSVAITTTVNLIFGSGLHDPNTGIILNDEMDDHSIPGVTNAFGLRPSPYNFIAPNKRSLSSQTPTLITQNNEILMSLGGSGGSRIVTAILEAIVRRVDWGYELYETVHSSRLHHQLLPHYISAERGVSKSVLEGLKERGHEVVEYDGVRSEIQVVEKGDGVVYAVSDARKRGMAAGY